MHRLALPLLASLFAASAVAAETFTFRFAPAVDRPVVQTVRTTTTTKTDGETTTRVVSERSVLRFRKTEGGYVLSASETKANATVDGKEFSDPLLKMLAGIDIRLEISEDGELRAVHGYDAVIRKIHDATTDLPAELRATLSRILTEEALVSRVRFEWQGRISGFAGQTVEVGDVYESEETFTMPTGDAAKFYVTTTIAGTQKCGSAECLRIVFRYDSDPEALKGTMDAIGKAMPDEAAFTTEGVTITGSGERVIDPRTMQIHSETNERTVRMTATGPDGSTSKLERTEKKEYTFELLGDRR